MRMAILAGLVVLLAGCGADEQASLSGPLTYERGGGLAGRRDRLVVKPDGSATLTVREKSKAVKLTGEELDTLASDLEAADLGSVPGESTSERPVPDAFGYRVSYAGDTVTTDSAAMPKKLRALMARLGRPARAPCRRAGTAQGRPALVGALRAAALDPEAAAAGAAGRQRRPRRRRADPRGAARLRRTDAHGSAGVRPSQPASSASSSRSASWVSGGASSSRWIACASSRPAWRSALRSTRATSRSPSRNGST